jgi:hypothetical protein
MFAAPAPEPTMKNLTCVPAGTHRHHAFEILHGNKPAALVRANLVNGTDVGVIERRRRPSFAAEALERLRIVGYIVRQKLEGDEASE